jgi:tRNA dimethylallyltransferase
VSDASTVLVVAGSTASGKTELSIELAREFDAEVVGADSRQIYRGMPIGTAAPSPEQLHAIRHHLVGVLEPHRRYSAGEYARDAIEAIEDIHRRKKRAIVVGGTGFYIRALIGNVALASQHDDALRDRLAREARLHSPDFLHEWLRRYDPARAEALGRNDTYRVVRALEIALSGPSAATRDARTRTLASAGLSWLLVFLDVPWSTVDERIALRTDAMLAAGLIEEAERIGDEAVAANAVGYPQANAYLRGWSTKQELRASVARATRRYARRQRAWFRGEASTVWLPPASVRAAIREKLGWF